MFDLENILNEEMIRERLDYEKEFISFEDIEKSDEMDFQISLNLFDSDNFRYEYEFCKDNDDLIIDVMLIRQKEADEFDSLPDFEFDFIDSCEKARDEYLIENYICNNELEPEFECDALDFAIAHYEEIKCPDYIEYYDDYDYMDYEDCYEANNFGGHFSNNDPFDSLDGYDYPEGPDENLEGFKYHEHLCCIEYEDIQIDMYLTKRYEFMNNDEIYLQNLIDKHLMEEKLYFEFIKDNEISDDEFIKNYAEDLVFI